MARTAIETVVEARRNKKKKKKKKEEEPVVTPPVTEPPAEPVVTEPITPPTAPQYFASDEQAIAVYGPNPTHAQRLELDYALMQGMGNIKGFGPDRGFTAQQATAAIPGVTEEERRAAFQEATGSAELRAELEEKIATPPEMGPGGIVGGEGPLTQIGKEAMRIEEQTLIGRIAQGLGVELDEKAAPMKGAVAALTAVGAGVAAAAPYVISAAAKLAIPKAILGGKGAVALIKTAVAGLGIFVLGRGIFDYQGGEMDTLRQGMKKVVEDGERIEAANRNGYPSSDTIELLTTMADEVSSAESRIKELGNFNVQYRVSKEYILDMQNARSARAALLRRVLAVENTAATGQAAFNPEALLFDVGQFK